MRGASFFCANPFALAFFPASIHSSSLLVIIHVSSGFMVAPDLLDTLLQQGTSYIQRRATSYALGAAESAASSALGSFSNAVSGYVDSARSALTRPRYNPLVHDQFIKRALPRWTNASLTNQPSYSPKSYYNPFSSPSSSVYECS